MTAIQDGGIRKSKMDWIRILILSIFGGVFIGFGGIFAVTAGGGIDPAIVTQNPITRKLLFALCFPIALILIVLVGAELFTGNVLYMIVSLLGRKTSFLDLGKSWALSFVGNYIGAVIMAAWALGCEFFTSEVYRAYVISIAEGKVYSNWGILFMKAIPCNMLVCIAIYIGISAEDILSKTIGMWIPITVFATVGFEHSIANVFFIHLGMFYGGAIGYGDWLYRNLLPVCLGNIIGGGLFFGCLYWFLYLYVGKGEANATSRNEDIIRTPLCEDAQKQDDSSEEDIENQNSVQMSKLSLNKKQ